MPRLELFAILLWFSFNTTRYREQPTVLSSFPPPPVSLYLSLFLLYLSLPFLPSFPPNPPILPSLLPALLLSTETLSSALPCYKMKIMVLRAEISP